MISDSENSKSEIFEICDFVESNENEQMEVTCEEEEPHISYEIVYTDLDENCEEEEPQISYETVYADIDENITFAKNTGHEIISVRGFAGEISEAPWIESRKSNEQVHSPANQGFTDFACEVPFSFDAPLPKISDLLPSYAKSVNPIEGSKSEIFGRCDAGASNENVKPLTPTLVFIVPYRNREPHRKMFESTMKTVLLTAPPHKIFYLHQKDNRSFNRGAMKNIGFLAVKSMYPTDYQNITLVFNDVDTMPAKGTHLNYETSRGVIKHFYGFDYTLGGIVSITAGDFEHLNGFPNFWAWGYEDNLLQTRANNHGIVIDRSQFYKIADPHLVHLVDTPVREVNRSEFDRFLQNTTEGINSIRDLKYEVNDETGFVDVLQFNTTAEERLEKRKNYDLRNGPAPFKDFVARRGRQAPLMRMHF